MGWYYFERFVMMDFENKNNLSGIKRLSPLVLALVGDSVFDLYIRSRLAMRRNESAHKLHVRAISYVSAGAQSRIVNVLYGSLSDEEKAIFRRGRNTKSATVPKNADVLDYRRATAFEAVLGYLYLLGRTERLNELLNMAAEAVEQGEENKTNGNKKD